MEFNFHFENTEIIKNIAELFLDYKYETKIIQNLKKLKQKNLNP